MVTLFLLFYTAFITAPLLAVAEAPAVAGVDWMAILIPVGILILLGMFVLVFVLLNMMSSEPETTSVARSRLKVMAARDAQAMEAAVREREKQNNSGILGDFKEDFLTFITPFAHKFHGKKSGQRKNVIKQLLVQSGEPENDIVVQRYLVAQVAVGIVVAGALAVAMLVIGVKPTMAIVCAIVGFLVGLRMPLMKLRRKAKKRADELYRRFPDVMDLMVTCVEGGLGLDATLQRVSMDIETSSLAWSHELRRVCRELSAGLPRSEVYKNLGERTNVEEIRSLSALLIQSEKLGTSIANVLRVYAEDVRIRRKQQAEEQAHKASIKMTPVLVLLIFPPLFIVLVGPGLLKAFLSFYE